MIKREISRTELAEIFKAQSDSYDKASGLTSKMQNYAQIGFERIFSSLNFLRGYYKKEKGKVLEIGSFPFFFTAALMELSDDEVTGIVAPQSLWPGEAHNVIKESTTIKIKNRPYPFDYWVLNVEKDKLPFEDGSFDLVVCSEVLEHLIQSPTTMISEINRVLKDGGILLLTTPNGLYWKFVHKLMFFGSWEQYSRYGVYGRHNKLWMESEVKDFLSGNNFQVLESIYADAKTEKLVFGCAQKLSLSSLIQDLAMLIFMFLINLPISFFRKKKCDQLYFMAKKTGVPKNYCPDYLYSDFKPSYNIFK